MIQSSRYDLFMKSESIACVVLWENADELMLCNGKAELCDRTLDQVAFAGTHNSFASSDEGFQPVVCVDKSVAPCM